MNLIFELLEATITFFRVLFGIPIIGILIQIGLFGPATIKTVKRAIRPEP